MIKQAKTKNKVLDLIGNRWSPRAFSPKEISSEDIETIIEAASWAPSAINEQPWRYIYAHKGTPGFDKMVDSLLPGNQAWAKNSAVLVLSIGDKNYKKTGLPNPNYLHDNGLANANLVTQALYLGIYSHFMGGFDRERTIDSFHLNENEDPIAFIALGYLGEVDQLMEPFKTRELAPRNRKPLEAISTDISYN